MVDDTSVEQPLVEHFIIVRVRETEKSYTATTDMGKVRMAIHDVAETYDLKVSDVPIRADRKITPWGTTVPYEAARALFEAAAYIPHFLLVDARQRKERKDDERSQKNPNWRAEQAQRKARRRAQRASRIVDAYILEYGEVR